MEVDDHPGAVVGRLLTDLLVNLGVMSNWDPSFDFESDTAGGSEA
jgi:hypothetical protein